MQKTKPTQHSVRELRALGLTPHFLACRSAQVSLQNLLRSVIAFIPWKSLRSHSCCRVLTYLYFLFYFLSAAITGNYKGKIVSVLSCGGITFVWSLRYVFTELMYILCGRDLISLDDFLQAANILNIHDVPNIWHVPLLLRVSWMLFLALRKKKIEICVLLSSFPYMLLLQNQNAHHSILKQLNLSRLVSFLMVFITSISQLNSFSVTQNSKNSSLSALQQHLIWIAGLRWLRLLITWQIMWVFTGQYTLF